jgi:hypothetical protein
MKKVLTIGEAPHDWAISAEFAIVRGTPPDGPIEERSSRLRTAGKNCWTKGMTGVAMEVADGLR